ncbi:hypothetical protein ACFQ0G_08455 [Streptomyces chiangmaiensis]
MERLGYKHYVSQGGDWGAVVSDKMAVQKPPGLLGIHVNFPATVPADIAKKLECGDPAPAGLSADEKAAYDQLAAFYKTGSGYSAMMVTRPQTVGYGLTDSPAGLAAWIYDKFAAWTDSGGDPERVLTKDEMLDDITLYWVTNTAVSSARLYWENNANNFNAVSVSIPAAVSVFPGEIYQAPRSWTERSYPNLIYFNKAPEAVTSRPGKSRRSSPTNSGPRSDRCADHRRVRRPATVQCQRRALVTIRARSASRQRQASAAGLGGCRVALVGRFDKGAQSGDKGAVLDN